MSLNSANVVGHRIIHHIQLGGTVHDLVGQQLVGKFIHESMEDKDIKRIALSNDFLADELALIYVSMVDCLMPNPCIICGANMLAATLPFMEPFRLEEILRRVNRDADGLTGGKRNEVIIKIAEQNAKTIWTSHTASRGKAKFEIDTSGSGLDSAEGKGCIGCFGSVAILLGAGLLILIAYSSL